MRFQIGFHQVHCLLRLVIKGLNLGVTVNHVLKRAVGGHSD